MSKEHKRRRKVPRRDAGLGRELVSAGAPTFIRVMLDVVLWWIDRGGRL